MKAYVLSIMLLANAWGQSLPNETVGFDNIVPALISTFDHADILALSDFHWRKLDSDLRIRLVNHPDFIRKVHLIVVEFASTDYQATLDSYIRGDEVSLGDLQKVWRNTTQRNGVWESPVYAEFFAAVRKINSGLPANQRIRVLAGDPSLSGGNRDGTAISVLKQQVLALGNKALLIYGGGHLYKNGGITEGLEANYPGRTFVVATIGGPYPEYQQFEGALKSSARPVLVSLKRAPFRDFNAGEFLGRGSKRLLNGVWVDAHLYADFTLGQMADACVYFGTDPAVETRAQPEK